MLFLKVRPDRAARCQRGIARDRSTELNRLETKMLKNRVLKPALAAVMLGSAIGLTTLGAAAASAAPAMTAIPAHAVTHSRPVTPRFAIECHGDVCIQTAAKGATLATVNAWADTTTFTGHFQLVNTGCGITVANSHPDKTWPAGGSHYPFTGIQWKGGACGDFWQITAWKHNPNGTYTSLGSVGFQI